MHSKTKASQLFSIKQLIVPNISKVY